MSQKQRVLEYLIDGNVLSRLSAWDELGILEAPARISELRREGYPIITEMVEVVNKYGERVRVARWYM